MNSICTTGPKIYRGFDFRLTLNRVTPDLDDPYFDGDFEGRIDFRKWANRAPVGDVLFSITTAGGGLVADASRDGLDIEIDAAVTNALASDLRQVAGDVIRTDGGDDVHLGIRLVIEVDDSLTEPS
jgi:hypothetical protein